MSTITYETRNGNCAEYGDLAETIAIVRADYPACVISDEWEPCGEGCERRLVWASDSEAANDDGSNAIGAIVRA